MMPMPPGRHGMKMPLPHMPKHMKPYCKIKEPYFYQHLMEMRGRMVEVATACKTLKGKLQGVFPDHILVETKEGLRCHIRLKEICFVCPMMDP